jgi:hypothetical protein
MGAFGNGPGRYQDRAVRPRTWLGIGAVTLGIGAAMVSGAAIAAADTGDGSAGGGTGSSESGPSAAHSRPGSSTSGSSSLGKSTHGTVGTRPSSSVGTGRVQRPGVSASTGSPGTSGSSDPSADTTDTTGAVAETRSSPARTAPVSDAPGTASLPSNSAPSDTATDAPSDASTPPARQSRPSPAVSAAPAVVVPMTVVTTPPAAATETSHHSGDVTTPAAAALMPTSAVATPTAAELPAPAATAWALPGLPTPNQILEGLQNFGRNLYLTVMNQLYGLQAGFATFRTDVEHVFGISHTVITTPGIYGNPDDYAGTFVLAQDYPSSALATVAMAWAKLSNTAPALGQFIDAATVTDSLAIPGQKMYLGPGTTTLVKFPDSYELLQDRNVRVLTQNYYAGQESKALNDIAKGLLDPTKVMMVAITGPVDGQTQPGVKTVVVTGIDTNLGIVTLNDPTRADGAGLTMRIEDFLTAWTRDEGVVTAQLSSSSSTPQPPSRTQLTWSIPAPDQIGQALQNAFSNVALAIVHQIEGVSGNLVTLTTDLARTFGVASALTIAPPAPSDIQFGNYDANQQYWYYQGNYATCGMMAVASVIGQLTGTMPPQQEIINLAATTPSGVDIGKPIYSEPDGAKMVDLVKLLNLYGINADQTDFVNGQRQLALDTMTTALSQKQGVIVFVNNNAMYNAYAQTYLDSRVYPPEPGDGTSNHFVSVISVNTTKNVVYVNDSALLNGKAFPLPLDKFMDAWKTSGAYSLITAERPVTPTT